MAAPIRNVAICANPIAGRGKGRAMAEQLRGVLETANFRANIILDPPNLIERKQLEAADAIITVGGDGTLRAVVARCLEVLEAAPPMLPVPMGTANLMCRHLGYAGKGSKFAGQVAGLLGGGKIAWLDAACANDQLFLLMAGIGLDAHIVHELDRIRKGRINFASYLLPAAMALAAYKYPPMEVRIDGERVFDSAPALAFVGNVKEYGTGFPILPQARSDDGLLDVCVIPMRSRLDAIGQFMRVAFSEHVQGEGVVYARGREIEIDSPQEVPMQIDGDPCGHTPARIRLLPMRVPFLIP
jgi:YegS/Rv2252/BmrU family lipid kinase